MGYYAVVMSLGQLGGPALAFFLVQFIGLQHIFFLTAGLACIAFLISIPVEEHRAPRVGPAPAWKLKTGIVSKPALPAAWLAFCMGMGVGPIMAFIAIFARQRGMDNPGIFFTMQALALMVARAFSGILSDRRGRAFVLIPGLVLFAAGLLLLPFTHNMLELMLTGALIGLGFGSAQPATMALTVDLVPPDQRGMAISTYFLGFDIGISLGSFALGVMVTVFGFGTTWAVAACCVLLGLLGLLKRGPRPRKAKFDPVA
jgi:MFS family permease